VKVTASVVACGLLAAVLLVPLRAEAQGASLAAARDLYAVAEYDGALAMLNGLLQVAALPPEDRQTVELYRTLCLMAVGKTADAAQAIDTMVARDPLYRPAGDDIPPRVRAALTDLAPGSLVIVCVSGGASACLQFTAGMSATPNWLRACCATPNIIRLRGKSQKCALDHI